VASLLRLWRQGSAFVELFKRLRGVHSKLAFCKYVLGRRRSEQRHGNSELVLDFERAQLCCGVGAGELNSYLEIFVDDDYQLARINLDDGDGAILDIGANIGIFSLAVASRFPASTIYALEPNPDAYRRLVRNLRLNSATKVSPFNLAAWSASQPVRLCRCRSTSAQYLVDDDDAIVAQAVSLDDFCEQNSIQTIGLLKIDVEGAEVMTLKGAVRVLGSTEWVLAECHSGELAREVELILKERGFRKTSERRVAQGGGVLRFRKEKRAEVYPD
jgi:FkbM family methyltransferase